MTGVITITYLYDVDNDRIPDDDYAVSDFSLAAQAFSMLAVLCYAVSFLMYLAYIVFPSLGRSRSVTMALCLLGFSIGQYLILSRYLTLSCISRCLVPHVVLYFTLSCTSRCLILHVVVYFTPSLIFHALHHHAV